MFPTRLQAPVRWRAHQRVHQTAHQVVRRVVRQVVLPALAVVALKLGFTAALLTLLATGPAAAQINEEVPFIVTPDHVTVAMLELAGVQPSDFVLDLGSGDGRIVITAARRFGARGLGVEIVPTLVERSRDNARRAGVAARAEFREQDLFKTDLTVASVITMYLLPEVNMQLRPALLRLAPGTRIVSHDWDLGDWHPVRTIEVPAPDKPVGREKLSRLHLWIVPAQVEGLWCGPGAQALRLARHTDRVDGTLRAGTTTLGAVGLLRGTTVQLQAHPGTDASLRARAEGETMRVEAASGAWAAWAGLTLQRIPVQRAGEGCRG
jgi:SAM-dependent methyltransferase